MLHRIALGALLALALGCSATDHAGEPPTVRIGAIDWYVDYDAALAVAKARDQALWVHFGENPG